MTKVVHTSSRKKTAEKKDHFSDFFRRASKKKKIEVFTEAARKANKDQRELVRHANIRLKAT